MRQTVIRDFVVLKNDLTDELPPVVIMHLPSSVKLQTELEKSGR
jgi:hypothetical protein